MSNCKNCIVKQSNELNDLTHSELELFTENKYHISLKKGETLMLEGMPTNGLYCIHSGKCKVTKIGSNGKEQIIKFIRKGDLIGHRSMLSGEAVGLNVIALEETQTCFMPKETVLEVFRNNMAFSQRLIQNISQQLNEANQTISNMAQKSVKSRLAGFILDLEELFGTLEDGFIDIKLTREEIGSTIGTATESAIRLISEFRKKNIIELKSKQFKILDKEALQEISDGN
ncbi:MAG: Crp/Fnr family transcriptional regulator [Flavobacteriaceae bacterium]|nr:Crp/Fnr family transcriptional regulator [Flavobacteriaceae bacterium]